MKYYPSFVLITILFSCLTSYGQIQYNDYSDLNPEAFRTALTSSKTHILLDVRTPEEFAHGHLAGAININFFSPDFNEQVQQLPAVKTIYVYCAVGGRSAKAARIFTDIVPDTKIYNLAGGLTAWQKADYPVQK